MMPRACLAWGVLALLTAGCGGPKTAPVSGRVTLDSKPLANATVVFVPVDRPAGKDPLPSSVGVTDEAGHYSLVLDNARKTKGAVVGKHKVIITLGGKGDPNDTTRTFRKQLPPRYNRKT